MVFFKLISNQKWIFFSFQLKNPNTLLLHPMAGPKMVHGGARFFTVEPCSMTVNNWAQICVRNL